MASPGPGRSHVLHGSEKVKEVKEFKRGGRLGHKNSDTSLPINCFENYIEKAENDFFCCENCTKLNEKNCNQTKNFS